METILVLLLVVFVLAVYIQHFVINDREFDREGNPIGKKKRGKRKGRY